MATTNIVDLKFDEKSCVTMETLIEEVRQLRKELQALKPHYEYHYHYSTPQPNPWITATSPMPNIVYTTNGS